MTIVYLLIPLGAVLMIAAAAALFWAIDSGQYDDLEGAEQVALESDENVHSSTATQRNGHHAANPHVENP
ncbi:MAG TPA: cbb3-type cytochrome oxidase assembly protein CcoS [Steroidobacteraceae bacterium]|nr:cbb3-type cytochrome oxidase assembly protein CcoS [Steroidobacteraceae bacterium]